MVRVTSYIQGPATKRLTRSQLKSSEAMALLQLIASSDLSEGSRVREAANHPNSAAGTEPQYFDMYDNNIFLII
jgi:hypothetical protein